ncbi:MAG: phosphate ABC transporter permease [Thermodesulfobacteriota bacterium]|nr:MAG: phosphate ABC transporter permease [Thermodesulfobacteriota bacterium]
MTVQTRLKKKETQRASSGIRRRKLVDFIATGVVSTGGIAVILSILAILVFIGIETVPLFQGVKSELSSSFILKESPELSSYSIDTTDDKTFPFIATGLEEYREIGFVITKDGLLTFLSLKDGRTIKQFPLTELENSTITSSFVSVNNKQYSFGTNDGFILPVKTNYKIDFVGDKRTITPEVIQGSLFKVYDAPLDIIAYEESDEEDVSAAAAYTSSGNLVFTALVAPEDDFGSEEPKLLNKELTEQLNGSKVSTIELDRAIENLFVGTENGKIFHWDVSDKENPEFLRAIDATDSPNTAITSLAFLLGDRSLLVGDEAGNVSVWFEVSDSSSPTGEILTRIHQLSPLELPITNITASARDRGFVASDEGGNINLYHATSGQLLKELKTDGPAVKKLSFAPKSNGILAIDDKGKMYDWELDNPHPETNLKTLFGKVWYEGYKKPEYVWQSTGGTDEFEPKLSLTPLAFGTLKGALYALFFAIPISIFGAICVSQFMHPSLRNTIKPIIEIMAALPSVVLGFLAGLWLAPIIEKIIPAVFTVPIVLTLFTLFTVGIWHFVPRGIKGRFKPGSELFILIPVIIIGILVSLWLNGPIENFMFGGNYKEWFYSVLGLQYDQRNSLIVGFAMGFAVIPIIFTISEDALSSVPKHMTAGSLALGANKWQTAIRVILPTASPGIFSAVMIGLGRAIGETMIVLMATGNTPIMDWSLFNGFRALSANIAVEIPEAPHGGTLYRVLFLAALLLFFFTFFINTVAEIVRHRLRKKYGQL